MRKQDFRILKISSYCLLIFYCLFVLSSALKAQSFNVQDYSIEYIDVSSGLSNNYAQKVIEDDIGYKWIASEGGLNKYDGKTFQVFNPGNTEAFRNENIETIYKDSDGDLWIGTKSGGLVFYDSRKEQFTNYNQFIFKDSTLPSSLRVIDIVEGSSGQILVGTWANGLFVFPKNSPEKLKRFAKNQKVENLTSDNFGNVWMSRWGQLYKYDPSEDRLISFAKYNGITCLLHDAPRGRLWLGRGQSNVAYVDLNDYSLHDVKPKSKGKGNVESMTLGSSGQLYVGTWGNGLYVSDTLASSFRKLSIQPSAKGTINTSFETILDIHLDDNGIIWVGTAFGGIAKLLPINSFLSVQNILKGNSLPDNNIYTLESDDNGGIWIGTYGGGVMYWDGTDLNRISSNITKTNTFHKINNHIFIGSREGIFSIDVNDPLKRVKAYYQQLKKITAIHHSTNDRLWVGTQQNGLYYIDNFLNSAGESPVVKVAQLNDEIRINELSEDKNGNIWIGTFNGLFLFHRESGRFLSENTLLDRPLSSRIINDMYLDQANDKLWLALSGGLTELTIMDIRQIDVVTHGTEQGLKNEFVTSIMKGSDEQIWIGTAYGLAKFRPDRLAFENYTEFEGLPAYSFNLKSATSLPDGKLIFGASDGFVAFDPREITYQQADPEVLFTELLINGQPVGVGEKINENIVLSHSLQHTDQIALTYEDEAFSFTVSTLDYMGKDNVLYTYRLRGFNENWSTLSKSREIRYTNLSPGDFTLEVKASRDNHHWSPVAKMGISISPPPWGTWYAYILYILIILGLTYLINYVAKRQAKLSANLEIERIAREKEHDLSEAKVTFFTNISHEFRTPLTLILSPITELLSELTLDSKVKDRLMIIEKNASRLLQLINQLLDFRKSENGLLKLRVATGDIKKFAKEVYLSFQTHADSKNIQYTFNCKPSLINLPFDRDKMEIALVNLISNAFKYSNSGGKIEVTLDQQEGNCIIEVADNGIGIPPENLDKVFDRFYQIRSSDSAKIVGSGIGLALTKNIVDLHHGEISVQSIPHEKTIFSIKIPIENKNFTPEEFIEDFKSSEDTSAYMEIEQSSVEEDTVASNAQGKERILIVDDNAEILSYLKTLTKEEGYEVLQATNGVEALTMANEYQPDLIISDVMMPEIDGITLCRTLKNDINTSHIPIILLTARTSTVYEVSGLETGADDYIKKPFHPAIVKTRINSLLDNRRKIREHFVNKIRFEPSNEIEATSTEEEFIQKAILLIQENIHDAEFGIESLMDNLAMSKSTLYRKLKSLTGMSITGFIRSVKLKRAAELILTVDWKLNQIAYESGFNDYKYFKNCFQEQFGCLPSEYKSNKSARAKEPTKQEK